MFTMVPAGMSSAPTAREDWRPRVSSRTAKTVDHSRGRIEIPPPFPLSLHNMLSLLEEVRGDPVPATGTRPTLAATRAALGTVSVSPPVARQPTVEAATTQVSLPQGSRRILLERQGSQRLSSQSSLDVRVSRTFVIGRVVATT